MLVSGARNFATCVIGISPDGVAPSRMVVMSASVSLPVHHIVQKFFSGIGSPGWSQKKAVKWLWLCGSVVLLQVNAAYAFKC